MNGDEELGFEKKWVGLRIGLNKRIELNGTNMFL
jgi:hypothetical protein